MSIVGTRPPLISETNLYEPHHKVRDIQNACNETTSKIIRLYHDPGAGGTTFSRCLAYDLSKEIDC